MRDSKTRREGRQKREVRRKEGKLLKYGGKKSNKKNEGFQFLEKLFFKFYGVKTKYSAGEVWTLRGSLKEKRAYAEQRVGKEASMAKMSALLDRHFIDGSLIPPLMGRCCL